MAHPKTHDGAASPVSEVADVDGLGVHSHDVGVQLRVGALWLQWSVHLHTNLAEHGTDAETQTSEHLRLVCLS